MPTPSYETPQLRYRDAYNQFLSSATAKRILDAYDMARGNPEHLREVLWVILGSEASEDGNEVPDLRTLQAMQRLLRGLEAIPDMQGLKAIDKSLWRRIQEFTDVKPVLQAYLKYLPGQQRLHELDLKWKRTWKRIKRELAPEVKADLLLLNKNPQMLLQKYPNSHVIRRLAEAASKNPPKRERSAKTLVAAALVEEFKHRRIASAYRKAATLLYEASPKLFRKLNDEDKADRLGRLVRSVPEDIRKREHARLFPSSLSF